MKKHVWTTVFAFVTCTVIPAVTQAQILGLDLGLGLGLGDGDEVVSAPELDPSSAAGALALLIATVLYLNHTRRTRNQ